MRLKTVIWWRQLSFVLTQHTGCRRHLDCLGCQNRRPGQSFAYCWAHSACQAHCSGDETREEDFWHAWQGCCCRGNLPPQDSGHHGGTSPQPMLKYVLCTLSQVGTWRDGHDAELLVAAARLAPRSSTALSGRALLHWLARRRSRPHGSWRSACQRRGQAMHECQSSSGDCSAAESRSCRPGGRCRERCRRRSC